jgi:hypothetical protein
MDGEHNNGGEGNRVIHWQNNGQANQQWRLTYLPNGFYSIMSEHVAALGLTVDPTGILRQNTYNSQNQTQHWAIVPNRAGDQFRLIPQFNPSLAAGIGDGGNNALAAAPWEGSSHQWWAFPQAGTAAMSFFSTNSTPPTSAPPLAAH